MTDSAHDPVSAQDPDSAHDPDGSRDDRGSVERGSGDRAIAEADERADGTRGLNIADVAGDVPVPADTANLRLGPELHPACLPLLPLVGVWRGTGHLGNATHGTAEGPDFGQQITVSHDGRPFLRFESIAWDLSRGEPAPGPREVGWLRPQPDESIELLLAHAEGRIEVFYGRPRSLTSWAFSTDGVWRTASGAPVVGATRLYGITADGRLAYVEERAHADAELAPHSSALLERLVG